MVGDIINKIVLNCRDAELRGRVTIDPARVVSLESGTISPKILLTARIRQVYWNIEGVKLNRSNE